MARTELAIRRSRKPAKLTDKQRAFVAEYVTDYNAVRAARAAGYAHPHAAGGKLIATPAVAEAIGLIQRENLERLKLSRERIVEELAYVALRDPIDLCDADGMIRLDDLRQLPERLRRCIDGIKVKQAVNRETGEATQTIELKLAPKTPAIELAMKHFGLLSSEKRGSDGDKQIVDWDAMTIPPDDFGDPVAERLAARSRDSPAEE